MKKILSYILPLLLIAPSFHVHAEWKNFDCYRKAKDQGKGADKHFSYNEEWHLVKLDKSEETHPGKFRGKNIYLNLPNTDHKLTTDIHYDKNSDRLTFSIKGGMFNRKKINYYCFPVYQ